MMRREFSSQHPAASSNSSTSSSTTTPPTSATTASPAASSPIHQRRSRLRTCRHNQRHASSSASTASGRHSNRQCSAQAIKTSTMLARNPALAHKLRQMALPLSPLVQLTTGAVHPNFPTNVLQFWLLTDDQLESLAGFYHQTDVAPGGRQSPWATQYPCPVRWQSDAPLEVKRRRMGRFIGLRGCESPVETSFPHPPPTASIKTEEEIAQEARMARLSADEEALRRKMAPGPWGR